MGACVQGSATSFYRKTANSEVCRGIQSLRYSYDGYGKYEENGPKQVG